MSISKDLSNKSLIIALRNQDNLNQLIEETSYLPNDISVSERAYCWKNGIKEIPKCPICGKPRKFYKMCYGYFPSCGDKECQKNLKSNAEKNHNRNWQIGIEKRKQTYIEKNVNKVNHKKNSIKEKKVKYKSNKSIKYCLDDLINQCKLGQISTRQLISHCKQFETEIFERTKFLDEYNADYIERLYNVLHGYNDVVRCKYCGNKSIFTGRMTYGYKEICNSKECRSKQISDNSTGKNTISRNRNEKFLKSIQDITVVDDNIILKVIKYERQLAIIDNNYILDYLIIKSLEEFNIQREQFKDLIELYYLLKKSKCKYRLSIDNFNIQFSKLISKYIYTKKYIFI